MVRHTSHRGAIVRCCPGQEMSGRNEASTHSRGTRPAVPPQLGLRLKRISLVVCVCVRLTEWALDSIISVTLACISPSACISIK